ncbi:hypothetical protein ACI65C_008983 [Semiaphis heraclei]
MAPPLTRRGLKVDLSDVCRKEMLADYFQTIERSRFVSLLTVTINDLIIISNKQDQKLADVFEKCSSIELPVGTKRSDFICCAPDVLPYNIKDSKNLIKLDYNCAEINGTGFGAIRTLPLNQFETILNTFRNSASKIKEECEKNGENPLIIVSNSGREGVERVNGEYPISSNSSVMWERLFIVDEYADQISSSTNPCHVDSIDNIAINYYKQIDLAKVNFNNGIFNKDEYKTEIKNAYDNSTISMKKYDNKPMVLLGYTRDIVECCKIEHDLPYLFGRRINGIVNDRTAFSLSKIENKEINYKKVHIMNVNFEEGADKFSTALAREQFHSSTEAKLLPTIARDRGFIYDPCGLDKLYNFQSNEEDLDLISDMNNNDLAAFRMRYFRGITEKDGINGIMKALDDFKNLGMKPLFKPSGTGESKGIIAYKTGESNEDFKQRFCENINNIKKEYGKGAGYPYMVMPILSLAKTIKGELYDLRFVIYKKFNCLGNSTIHTIPLLLRKGPENIAEECMENNDFFPTNLIISVLKTGRPGTDFVVPLCREDSIKQANLTNDQIKTLALEVI